MSNSLSSMQSFSPLRLQSRSLVWQAGAVVLGTLFLALSSYVEVPMVPVPMTMQTLVVLVIGATYGWRLAGATVLLYIGEGMLGLPVFWLTMFAPPDL